MYMYMCKYMYMYIYMYMYMCKYMCMPVKCPSRSSDTPRLSPPIFFTSKELVS